MFRHMNRAIEEQSKGASLVLLPTPRPPAPVSARNAQRMAALNYVQQLNELAKGLPATLLVVAE